MNNVTTIPVVPGIKKTKRVAIYARVSTLEGRQDSSYQLQVGELTKSIVKNPDYELICIYADKESGKTNKRSSFQKMMDLARAGGIDLIVTKSISRFGRNTINVIEAIQELRKIGIEIYFEKENMSTLDPTIDFMLTILAAYAEEESNQISTNTKWSIMKKMKRGGNTTTRLYGYHIEKETFTIKEDEARVVSFIFDSYLQGMKYKEIIELLKERKIPSPNGNETWSQSTLEVMLNNEKYTGDNLLQKTLYGKSIKNLDYALGRVNQYLVRNNHPRIISREKYDLVQQIRNERTKHFHKGESHKISPYAYYFYSVDLGKYLTRIVEKHNDKYEVEMLLGHKNKERVSFRFEYIKEGVIQMAKYLVENKASIAAKLKEIKKAALAKLELEKERLYKNLEGLPLSEKLETYGQISDVLLRIEKLSKLSEMIENYMRIAKKLSNHFDIDLAKELFASIIIKRFDINLIISLGINETKIVPSIEMRYHSFCKTITHLFQQKSTTFNLYIE
ncbi:MAG: recombinase family protein [Firmicutes bacterium]|nr:recombinase family protein [Bacillota bacterium]